MVMMGIRRGFVTQDYFHLMVNVLSEKSFLPHHVTVLPLTIQFLSLFGDFSCEVLPAGLRFDASSLVIGILMFVFEGLKKLVGISSEWCWRVCHK